MTIGDAVIFYDRYVGLMKNEQIHEETGHTVDAIRRKKILRKGQLCWYCSKATSSFGCEWVRNCESVHGRFKGEYPEFVKTETVHTYKGDLTFITECKEFEDDGRV